MESCLLGLTSYNFNFDAAAISIVHYLMHPDAAHWIKHRSFDLRGVVMARATG
jgi:hypothetical protein